MADSNALRVAIAAQQAVEFVGMPEARIPLAHATIYIATAPKSNKAAMAIWNARSEVQAGAVGEVPPHLRDAHYQGAQTLGHGVGYEYPHDHPDGWVRQQYLPDEQADKRYYQPSRHGREAAVADKMDARGQGARINERR